MRPHGRQEMLLVTSEESPCVLRPRESVSNLEPLHMGYRDRRLDRNAIRASWSVAPTGVCRQV
jgi:hypothetical protein